MATFYNRATLTYNNFVTNSNTVSGEILEVLTADKTAIRDEYTVGDELTYVISLVNTGATPLTGLTVTDDLGAYLFGGTQIVPLAYVAGTVTLFSNGVLQPTPTVTSESPLTVTGITVPANGSSVLIYTVRVNDLAPLDVGATVTNTATVSGGGITPVTVDETVTASAAPYLTISKALSPTTVAENGQITYTFVIRNLGNTAAVATDNVSVSDTFDPPIEITEVTLDGVALTSPTDYTYDTATGLFTTVPGRITVPAATYTQDPVTGEWVINPASVTLRVVGTV